MLNAKQIAFCHEYIIDRNGRQAAIRAGYSERSAEVTASRLLTNAKVKALIAELEAELRERAKLNAEDVIEELRALAFWSINDFVSEGNVIKDVSQLTREVNKPVIGIKTKTEQNYAAGTSTTTVELKLADKRASLVDLGRHLGIFKEDNDQKAIKIKVTKK